MTTLYRSVLIESAEQAEAMPPKTFAVHSNSGRSAYRIVFGGGVFWHEGMSQLEPRNLVGWTALVPVEAEEEWTVGHKDPAWAPGTEEWAREFQTHEPGRRLFRRSTTPWEEA